MSLQRYRGAIERFLGWELSFYDGVATTIEQLDEHLAHDVKYSWQNGDGRVAANQTLACAQHFLLRRRAFPQAWALVRIWHLGVV